MKDEEQSNSGDTIKEILELPFSEVIKNSQAAIFLTDDEDIIRWRNKIVLAHRIPGADLKLVLNKSIYKAIEFFKGFVKYPEYYKQKITTLLNEKKPQYGLSLPIIDGSTWQLDFIPLYSNEKYLGTLWQIFPYRTEKTNTFSDYSRTGNLPPKILKQIGFSYLTINKQGKIIQTSDAFARFLGYTKARLIHTDLGHLCISGKEKLKDLVLNNHANLSNQQKKYCELELKTVRSSKWIRCFVIDKTKENQSNAETTLLITDITTQKENQKELEEAKSNAEKAQKAQQQFFASMSHDIRTPLNAIIGMNMLMDDMQLNEEQREYFLVSKNASAILLDLLNDILDFSKIETGQQEIHEKEFDLPQLICSLINTFDYKLQEENIELIHKIDSEIDHLISGDPLILNQVLMNLLTNAKKFTSEGHISITSQIEKSYENTIWIKFSVSDTGIGIDENEIKNIFKDFRRSSNLKTHYDGSGLGLFICKRLVGLMGGELKVNSTLNKGSTFYFSVPFEKTQQPINKASYDQLHKDFIFRKDIRLLVVEDNAMNIKYLSGLLRKNNIVHQLVKDGKEAWKTAKETYFNLILMDRQLPEIGGLEVTSLIRKTQNPNKSTPIILLSADTLKEVVKEAKEVGINDFLPKPFTPEQLLNILYKYLKDRKTTRNTKKEDAHFEFNESLDTTYLNHLYAGNSKYAQSLFKIFLDDIENDISQIQNAIHSEEWDTLKDLLHKIKPNFSMVGMTWLTEIMQEAYDKLKAGQNKRAIVLLKELQTNLNRYLPLIEDEYRRMK